MNEHEHEERDVSAVVDSFLCTFQQEHTVTKNTLYMYRYDLGELGRRLSERGLHLLTATHDDLVRDIEERINDGANVFSVRRGLSSYRHFYQHLVDTGVRTDYPMDKVTQPLAAPQYLSDIPTQDEVNALLNAPDISTPIGCRDRTMFEVLLAAGIRVSECITLTLSQVDLEKKVLDVGTGMRERHIPLSKRAYSWVSEYVSGPREEIISTHGNGILFPSNRGVAMTRQALWHIVKKNQKKAGFEHKKLSPNIFRYLYIIFVYAENGGKRVPTYKIQRMLGHSDASVTVHQLKRLRTVDMSQYVPLSHGREFSPPSLRSLMAFLPTSPQK